MLDEHAGDLRESGCVAGPTEVCVVEKRRDGDGSGG